MNTARLDDQSVALGQNRAELLSLQDSVKQSEIDAGDQRDRKHLQDSIIRNQEVIIERLGGSLISANEENTALHVCIFNVFMSHQDLALVVSKDITAKGDKVHILEASFASLKDQLAHTIVEHDRALNESKDSFKTKELELERLRRSGCDSKVCTLSLSFIHTTIMILPSLLPRQPRPSSPSQRPK